MIKEGILMAVLGLIGYERRKRSTESGPHDRRRNHGKLNGKSAAELLKRSVDQFSETVICKKEELERK